MAVSKIFLRMVKMLLFIGVMSMFHIKLAGSQSLATCTNPIKGSSCRLTCTTADVSQAIFFFKLPATGSQEGGCSGGTCGATGGNPRYVLTQDASTSETYLDIPSLVYADDDSQWGCEYGSGQSTSVQLTVKTAPTVVQFAPDPPTSNLPQTITGKAYCVYPVSSLTMSLVYKDGQNNNTLDMAVPGSSTLGTNGCASHEYTVTKSYQLTSTTLSGKSVQFWIRSTVSGQVLESGLSTETFIFPETTTTTITTTITITTPASSIIDEYSPGQKVLLGISVVFSFFGMSCAFAMYCDSKGNVTCTLLWRSKNNANNAKFEYSLTVTTIVACVVTVICVIGLIFGIVGILTTNLILTIVGFTVTCVMLILVIVSWILIKCGVVKLQRCGNEVNDQGQKKGETGTNADKTGNVTDDQKGGKDTGVKPGTPEPMKGIDTDHEKPRGQQKVGNDPGVITMKGIDKHGDSV